jgi:asparagine synthase (glutamine-hydrolysing)
MCGITGIINYSNEDKSGELNQLADIIAHRGPDGNGSYIHESVYFAHRRLAIIDLSQNAAQPFISDDSNYILIFNGELYNFKIIRERLIELGYKFKSESDSEVVLYSYCEWGKDCLEKFNGIFAFAIYDKLKDQVFIVRDELGVKPLYYYIDEQNNFYFSSELKPFYKLNNFCFEINKDVLAQYLISGYIAGANSIFHNCYRLSPGAYIEIDLKSKKYTLTQYFDEYSKDNKFTIPNKQSIPKDIFSNEIKEQLVSDVPIGAFLSGGTDSTLVAALMKTNSKKAFKTFSLGSDESPSNENPIATKVAEILGLDHTAIRITSSDIIANLDLLSNMVSEPYSDFNIVWLNVICKAARKKGIKVMFSGDGGDELFLGYPNFKIKNNIYYIFKFIPFNIRKYLPSKLFSFSNKIYKFLEICKMQYFEEACIYINGNGLTISEVDNVLKNEVFDIKKTSFYSYLNKTPNLLKNLKQVDIKTYLVNNGLYKTDLAGMYAGVEIRVPLLGKRIQSYAATFSESELLKSKALKQPLKTILEGFLPKKYIYRKKQGFAPTNLKKWLTGDLKYLIDYFFSKEILAKQNIFNYPSIQGIINTNLNTNVNFSHKIWILLLFQIWYFSTIEKLDFSKIKQAN